MNAELHLHDNEEANECLIKYPIQSAAHIFIKRKWTTEKFLATRMEVTIDRLRAWMDFGRSMNGKNKLKLLRILSNVKIHG